MALTDIFKAITTESETRANAALKAHQEKMKSMHDEAQHFIEQKRQRVEDQKKQKMQQIKEKAQSHARMVRNRTLLAKKRECMDRVYQKVLQDMVLLPADKTEILLQQCVSAIQEIGTFHPAATHEDMLKKLLPPGCKLGKPVAAKGGFLFDSPKKEYDFTYEFLVENLILPKSEVNVAAALFSTTA